jgi:transcriptional regulator with XRE-family HTH domain
MPPPNLKKLRLAEGLTGPQLAVAIGVDPTTLWRWESGAGQIPDKRKAELAERFGVTIAYLMGWDDNGDENGGDVGVAA